MKAKNFFGKILDYWFKPRLRYQSLIEIRIFEDAILHNLKVYQQKYPFLDFAPVLKSNAYGHGLVKVALILDDQNLPFFVVDSFYEALTLRQYGVKTRILILGYASAEQIFQNVAGNISIGITSLEQLKMIAAGLDREKMFQLKIDTGMNRQGIIFGEIKEAIKLIKSNGHFILEGICTHLADADNVNSRLTEEQVLQWNQACEIFKEQFPEIKYFHAVASAGVSLGRRVQGNICRLGIGLYGINILPDDSLNLQPALEMLSVISSVKKVEKGRWVGYHGTFIADKPIVVALLPLGYNEGVDRRLSGRGFILVSGQFCPIVGRVSMNITAIDVSAVAGVKLSDEAVIISRHPQDLNSIKNIATSCGTIPYEILVGLPTYLKRTLVGDVKVK